MKNRRIYDFNTERPAPASGATVRELLIDGWSAYYKWRARLRKRLTAARPKQNVGPTAGSRTSGQTNET